jgi:hypothetical protein
MYTARQWRNRRIQLDLSCIVNESADETFSIVVSGDYVALCFSTVMPSLISYFLSNEFQPRMTVKSWRVALLQIQSLSVTHTQHDSIMIGRMTHISYWIQREHSAAFKVREITMKQAFNGIGIIYFAKVNLKYWALIFFVVAFTQLDVCWDDTCYWYLE